MTAHNIRCKSGSRPCPHEEGSLCTLDQRICMQPACLVEDTAHLKFFVSSMSERVYENISRPRRLWPPSCGVRLPARRADPGWRWVSAYVCAHVIAMHSLDSKFPSGGKWQESSPLMGLNPQLNPQLNIKQSGAR